MDHDAQVLPFPHELDFLIDRLKENGIVKNRIDQMIVNEYTDAEGIRPHIDSTVDWGDTVVSLSLGSSCKMQLTPDDSNSIFKSKENEVKDGSYNGVPEFNWSNEKKELDLFLDRRSLMVMKGEARYHWKHGIRGEWEDEFGGRKIPRGRRVSLTFRTYIGSKPQNP